MAIMIPASLSPDIQSNAEKHIFDWFKKSEGTDDWVILHSLGIASHQRVLHGETDFFVLAPGLGIFALEVKGGRVKRELGKWSFVNRFGDIDFRYRGPFDQAWEGIYSIRKSIESKLDNSHRYLNNALFGIGVMFPDIDYQSVGVDEEPWQVFDIKDGKNVKHFIERIALGAHKRFDELGYDANHCVLPTKEDVRYLTEILRGDFDFDVPLRIKQKYTEEALLSLTNEQALCVEQLEDNPRALIRGTAGTGKTMLAIEASKRAVANGEKVALFCFNRLLGEWLEDRFSDKLHEDRPAYVGSFHRFLAIYLYERGYISQAYSGNTDGYYSEELPRIVSELLNNKQALFDRIIIDEAQDLLNESNICVMDLLLRGGISKGRWTMFGDFSMQSIYVDGMNEEMCFDMLQDYSSFAVYRLKKNCRNTKKICIEIENIVGIPENAAHEDTIDVPAVEHITYLSAEDQKKKLETLLLNLKGKSIAASDIVILSPKKREKSVVGLMKGFDIADYSVQGNGKIRFSTIHAYKGLESSTVILTDIENYNDIKLIYVALSRAQFSLFVFETEKASADRARLFFQRRQRL